MKHTGPIFFIGIILVIMPLLGLPTAWKNFMVFIFGVYLCGIVLASLKRSLVNKVSNNNESRAFAGAFGDGQSSSKSSKSASSIDPHDQSPQS